MSFSKLQLQAVAQTLAEQILGSALRPLSDITGILPNSYLGYQADIFQDVRQAQIDNKAPVPALSFVKDIVTALENEIANPVSRNFDSYRDANNQISGFRIGTTSRGGATGIFIPVFDKHGISHSYGCLPTLSIYAYDDGHVILDKKDQNRQVISYEGFNPDRKWIEDISELADCEKLEVINPRHFLVKQVMPGADVKKVHLGKKTPNSLLKKARFG